MRLAVAGSGMSGTTPPLPVPQELSPVPHCCWPESGSAQAQGQLAKEAR